MKAKLHKFIGAAVFGLTLVSHSLSAWAGHVYKPEVSVYSSSAYGSMVGARYSGDTQQSIYCGFYNVNGQAVYCNATDKTGKSLSCSSSEPQYLAVFKTITDSSQIYFSVTPGTGRCSYFEVNNNSMYLR